MDDIDMNLIDDNLALQTCNRDKNREEKKENETVAFTSPPAPGFSDRDKSKFAVSVQ